VNKLSIQTEQRLAFLFFKLYKRTGNNNYRNIALKYVEYFRNKPITQAGLNDQIYGVLQQMAVAEYNNTSIYEEKEDYTLNLITHHRYVSKFLAPTEAMIAYYCYNDPFADSIILISQFIRADSDTIVEISYAKNELANLPDKIYEAVEHADLNAYKTNAYKAYQLFLKPIINLQPNGINNLIIIPPAYYNKPLIFEGFLENLNGTGFEDLTYVFNSKNIIYENSFTHFIAHKNNKVKVNMVKIWNPDYSKTNLANITEGNKIVEHITKFYRTDNIISHNKNLLKEELLSGEILQVLAHADGKFDLTQRPVIYTALPGKDSVLYDYELETTQGKCAFVILAACKSNVGYLMHNGIVDGFTRAFITAGNAATIASIHNVEESATVELVNLFYTELGKGKSTGEAFNAAKFQLKSAYPNPMVWQAFIYTGSDFYLIPTSSIKVILVLGGFFVIYALIALMLIQTKF
jgi:CHAT domain-containing protein